MYLDGILPITEDIQINGTVVISSAQLEMPKECLNRQDCRHLVGFSGKCDTDGVSIISYPGYYYPPGTLILANVRLRFRPQLIGTNPWVYSFVPVIQLILPSDYECEESHIKCEYDNVCYSTSGAFCSYCSYCQYCLGLSYQDCVCRNEDGVFPDGTGCEFFVSADAIMTGECQNSKCEIEW